MKKRNFTLERLKLMRCWIKYFVLVVFLDFIYLEASNQLC